MAPKFEGIGCIVVGFLISVTTMASCLVNTFRSLESDCEAVYLMGCLREYVPKVDQYMCECVVYIGIYNVKDGIKEPTRPVSKL